jgi:hypothetical protein
MVLYYEAGAPNTKFFEGIKNEHTVFVGSDLKFTTGNYNVTTTPKKEYLIATERIECPDADMLDRNGLKVRVIPSIDALKTREICTKARLEDYEILAVVGQP